jgi:hypothetical protein
MAKSDGAGMPKHRKRPLLLMLRESGDALECRRSRYSPGF